MVVKKCVNFHNNFSEIILFNKNPNENDGMTDIDLSANIEEKKKCSIPQFRHKRLFYSILGLIFIALTFGMLLVLFDIRALVKMTKYDTKIQPESFDNEVISIIQSTKELKSMLKDKIMDMTKCLEFKTHEYCCDIFSDNELQKIQEPCTVDRILELVDFSHSLITTDKTDNNLRRKREWNQPTKNKPNFGYTHAPVNYYEQHPENTQTVIQNLPQDTSFSTSTKQPSVNQRNNYKDTVENQNQEFRINQGTLTFGKNKADAFSTSNVDLQTNQQSSTSTCFNPFTFPNLPAYQINQQVSFPYDTNQLMKSSFFFNPPISPYQPQPFFSPFGPPPVPFNGGGDFTKFLPALVPSVPPMMQKPNNVIQATGPNGQLFMCSPFSSQASNIAGLPGVEVRRLKAATNLQDLLENVDNNDSNNNFSNKSRHSLSCGIKEKSCADGSKCIKKHQFCNGDVNCKDASDEVFCSCRERLARSKLCDGFFDCPNGEDEIMCSGCSAQEFSCDDRSRFHKSTCIPIRKRCDGILDCPTGKDENDCFILTDTVAVHESNKISNAVGFLHRYYKGRWYPVCQGVEFGSMQVCQMETSNSNVLPTKQMIKVDDENINFVNFNPQNDIWLTDTCVNGKVAMFIQCPPLQCGVRAMMRHHFRPRESDDSIEDIIDVINNVSDSEEDSEEELLGASRIVGGKRSQPAAWPWLVSIYKDGIFTCGGAIINEFWILSAAHCVDKFWLHYYEVQAGMLRRFSHSPMEQDRFVTHAIAYPYYDKSKLQNDISLMRMSAPVRFNRFVRPICLPSTGTAGLHYKNEPTSGTICTTAGWGATVEHGADPDQMREVEIPIRDTCKYETDIEGREICAGFLEGGKDACQGDSGGPLLCRNPDNRQQWYLAGIVSHGEGCARPNEPGVYTRVSQFLDWISDNARDDNLPQVMPLNQCPGHICKGTGRCLPKRRRCDKFVDCLFADDEVGCDIEETNKLFKLYAVDDILQPIDESTGEQTLGGSLTTPLHNNSYDNGKFLCKEMLQMSSLKKRCDYKFDCEDATDELNCTCAEYLMHNNSNAICDGVTDCLDLTDELDCATCDSDEFYCRESRSCIALNEVCDGKPDCPLKEDENDCFALAKDNKLKLDHDLRPNLNKEGLLYKKTNTSWSPFCIDWKSNVSIAATICQYLGFSKYNKLSILDLHEETVEGHSGELGSISCTALNVKCSKTPLNRIDRRLQNLAWFAGIYINGVYRCLGAILDQKWILTTSACSQKLLKLKNNHATVLVGAKKMYLNQQSPYEQIARVIESIEIEDTNITLLQLEKKLNFTRYVQPLSLSYRVEKDRERCFAIGADSKGIFNYIPMEPSNNCTKGFKCFKKANNKDTKLCNSPNIGHDSWNGLIFCEIGDGFYPAALFFEPNGLCAFDQSSFVNLVPLKPKILSIMERVPFKVASPKCDGFRCKIGNCINKNDVCNGIPDCRNGEDEDVNFCGRYKKDCESTNNCTCLHSELRCSNGKCVSKKVFCDKTNDCGDYSDQPDVCTCKSYLEVTNPSKICDGEINCEDKTDEIGCPCTPHDYKCEGSDMCVSNYMVCDGSNDCPNGDDEEQCFLLKSDPPHSGRGEVMTRFAGKVYHGCFPDKMTVLEMEDVCRKIGFTAGIAYKIPAPLHKADNITVLKPVFDEFDVIFLRRTRGQKFRMHLRTADRPYVRFDTDVACSRLFLECV